jgi:cytosine/creatinine deaminase
MLIDAITGARLGAAGEQTLSLAGGRVAQIRPGLPGAASSLLDAGGRAVVPAFVDAHVHLDKAFLDAHGACAPRLDAAISAVAALRQTVPLDQVRAHAERALELLVRNGVVAARVHAEVDPTVGLTLVELQQELVARFAERIELQLVAFPQRGLELAGTRELMEAALRAGVPVVGGCPYVDRDPGRHLDFVFTLAERHDAPIDLHLDFSDDPGRSLLALVAERVRAHGVAGRVTLGHVTTLAALAPHAQAAALDLLASAGIALVVLPATDLYLAGHGEPGTRSLAPIARARRAGVRVAIANNNLHNPFAPFGNASLLHAAWLAGIVQRMSDAEGCGFLLEAISREPAAILGLPVHGPIEGALAHLLVLDTDDPARAVSTSPPVLATLRSGRLTHHLAGLRVH